MVATRSSSSKTPEPPTLTSATTTANKSTRQPASRTRNNNNSSRKNMKTVPSSSSSGWTHTPTTLTLAWLAISLPLVIWDTGYVLGRPATMPGGWAHAPLYTPYALYGEVDHMYGFKQWNLGNGFTAAQGTLNTVETIMYLVYFAIWCRAAPAAAATATATTTKKRKSIAGKAAAWAVVFAFSAAVMTLSKTVLYWLNEAYSGWDNIGHNSIEDLILLWIIPKYVSTIKYQLLTRSYPLPTPPKTKEKRKVTNYLLLVARGSWSRP